MCELVCHMLFLSGVAGVVCEMVERPVHSGALLRSIVVKLTSSAEIL